MSSITIPTDGKWQSNPGSDLFGHIARTKNIDLLKQGHVRLARKATTIASYGASSSTDNGEDPAFGNPLAIIVDTDFAYTLTDVALFTSQFNLNTFNTTQVSLTSGPTFGSDSDITFFGGKIVVSGGVYISNRTAGAGQLFTRKVTDLTNTVPHPLCTFEGANTLLVGDIASTTPVVRQFSTSYAEGDQLSLPEQYVVTCLRCIGSRVYIGTRNIYGGEAKIFVWNGSGTQAQGSFGVGADWVYSMCEYKGSIAIVTSAGQIRLFQNGPFVELGAFPIYNLPYSWGSDAPTTSLVGKVASRGMSAVGDLIYINIDGSINNSALVAPGQFIHDMPSGLWCLDPNKGLYHKAGYNHKSRQYKVPTDIASSYAVFSSAHQAQTGDPVLVFAPSITGLTSGQVYYAIVDDGASALTCKLALSRADAFAGRHIDISGTPSTDFFIFDRYETLGATHISSPGGVCALGQGHPSLFYGSEVLFGGSAYDSTLTARGCLMSLGMARNAGYLVTPKIRSSAVTDTFRKVYQTIAPLRLDTDKVVVKYRTSNRFGLPTPLSFSGNGTWTSSTTFTVDTLTHDFKSVEVGDEVEIVSGQAAGYTAHITAIDSTSSTYTVTVDETLPTTNADKFYFTVDNWTKIDTVTNEEATGKEHYAESGIGAVAGWIQFKIEFRGTDLDLEQIINVSDTSKKSS